MKTTSILTLIALSLTLALTACGGTEEADVHAFRGPINGQVPAGSCQGVCGKRSTGGCWCDAQCAVFGDCCADKESVCSNKTCAPTGVACSPECPPNGVLPGGAPCQAGVFDVFSCTCKPLDNKTKTCGQVSGTCHALTATGVACPSGTKVSAEGLCGVGGGCCVPSSNTCPPTGVGCLPNCPASGQLPGGAPCTAGNFDVKTCTCVPVATKTCAQAGGSCGALTASGLQCAAGYVAAPDAGTCGLGGGCCMPKS
jgi:Somatomedin B domain